MGPLKIKTGLSTSPISQRALITQGQLITKCQLKSPFSTVIGGGGVSNNIEEKGLSSVSDLYIKTASMF